MIGIRMAQDDSGQPLNPESGERRQKDSLSDVSPAPAAAVHQEGLGSVAQEDRFTLPHVQEDELGSLGL